MAANSRLWAASTSNQLMMVCSRRCLGLSSIQPGVLAAATNPASARSNHASANASLCGWHRWISATVIPMASAISYRCRASQPRFSPSSRAVSRMSCSSSRSTVIRYQSSYHCESAAKGIRGGRRKALSTWLGASSVAPDFQPFLPHQAHVNRCGERTTGYFVPEYSVAGRRLRAPETRRVSRVF